MGNRWLLWRNDKESNRKINGTIMGRRPIEKTDVAKTTIALGRNLVKTQLLIMRKFALCKPPCQCRSRNELFFC